MPGGTRLTRQSSFWETGPELEIHHAPSLDHFLYLGAGTLDAWRPSKTLIYNISLMAGQTWPYDFAALRPPIPHPQPAPSG